MYRNYSIAKQRNLLIDHSLKLLTNIIQLDEERELLNYTNTLLLRRRYEGSLQYLIIIYHYNYNI